MQASVTGEVRWRFELYKRIFEFCKEGQFSYARFLALVPDRLRLAVGDQGARVRIPVAIADDLTRAWRIVLPGGEGNMPIAGVKDPQELRRVIRFAQLDAEIEPLSLLAWLRAHGDALLKIVSELYLKAFSEIGAGEGGEEAAYLTHLLITSSTREALSERGVGSAWPVVASALLDLGLKGFLETDRVRAESMSARLGFQYAATLSPFSLGAIGDDVAKRALNAYRTNSEAVRFAKRVLQEPFEIIPLSKVVDVLTERMMVDPQLHQQLLRDVYLDRLRDTSLVVTLQRFVPGAHDPSEPVSAMAGSGRALLQTAFNARRRKLVIDRLQGAQSKPERALLGLLSAAERIEAGDADALGVHGNIRERAQLAAMGAVLLVLDERTEQLKQDVTALVHHVDPDDVKEEYEEGRCYLLALDQRPLYLLVRRRKEALIYIEVSGLAEHVSALKPRSMGDFLWRYFYQPLFDAYEGLRGHKDTALSLCLTSGAALAFRGDVVAVVTLAEEIRKVLHALDRALTAPVSDVLGGSSPVSEEAAQELERLRVRLTGMERAMDRVAKDRASVAMLRDGKALLESRIAVLSSKVQRGEEPRAVASVYIGFGEVAETVDISAFEVGTRALTFWGLFAEAEKWVKRSRWVQERRAAELLTARQVRNSEKLERPFRADIRARFKLELPKNDVRALRKAVSEQDMGAAAFVGERLGAWLHGYLMERATSVELVEQHIDREPSLLNEGTLLSEAALEALKFAKSGTVHFSERDVRFSELPEHLQRAFLFDRETERLLFGRRALDDTLVYLLRLVGEGDDEVLWELLPVNGRFAVELSTILGSR